MALNLALKKKLAAKPAELSRKFVVDLYAKMLVDLEKETDNALVQARSLVENGAPAQMLIDSLVEQYPTMAVMAESQALQKNNLTQETLLKAVEKFEKDPELETLLQTITNLSEKFNALNDGSIVPIELPAHLTPELVLEIAQKNVDITIRVVKEISVKQKNDKLPDGEAAALAEKNAQEQQKENFVKYDVTQQQLTAAIMKFSSSNEDFQTKMSVITNDLTSKMQVLRAEELGISVEELNSRMEIQNAVEMMYQQGMTDDQIEEVLKQALDPKRLQEANEEVAALASDAEKKKKKKSKKHGKKKTAKSESAHEVSESEEETEPGAASLNDVE